MTWTLSLPMYNVTPDLASRWHALLRAVLGHLRTAGVTEDIVVLDDPRPRLPGLWRRPDMLLSQTCGYPLMHHLPDGIQVVAAPVFDLPGCEGAFYRSVVVVSDVAYRAGAVDLPRCRGLRAAYNSADSHSGMNAFREVVAPYATAGRFFASTIETGSHLASLAALAEDRADVASIDCVTWAFATATLPWIAPAVRRIGETHPAPGLPFIASPCVDAVLLERLRSALANAVASDPMLARSVCLKGIAPVSRRDYDAIVVAASRAEAAGYPILA